MARGRRTISDVARQAGVSVATVSRALNGGKISSASRQRVEAAIRALGYQRNTLARSLVTGRSEVVGVLVPDVLGPLYAQIARGIEDVLTPLGMQYTLVTSGRALGREGAATRFLLEQQVDGLILVGSQLEAAELSALVGQRCPVVMVQREAEPTPFSTIQLDNAYGVELALAHLAAHGHRRIAHVAGLRRDGQARQLAYEGVMRAWGLKPRVVPSDSTEAGGTLAAAPLLADPEVTAVLCSNDRVALGLYHALGQRGCAVPADLSLVGFDDLPWTAYLSPPLTTLRQPGIAIGSLAARLLLDAGQLDADTNAQPLLVRPELIVRESVSQPRGGDPALSA